MHSRLTKNLCSSNSGYAHNGLFKKEKRFLSADSCNNQNPKTAINHLVLLPDGNRRWAARRELRPEAGYQEWIEKIPPLLSTAWNTGVHTITLSLMHPLHLKRPPEQIAMFGAVCDNLFDVTLKLAHVMKVKIVHLGEKTGLPQPLLEKLCELEQATSTYEGYCLNLGMNYSGSGEILHIAKKIITNKISVGEIDNEKINRLMYLGDQKYPHPDLVIRTGKRSKLSDFMLQLGQAELCFSDKLFPDFSPDDLVEILNQFPLAKPKYVCKL